MKKVIEELKKTLPKSIALERISGSMLRIMYDTSVFSFVENEKVQDIVATTGYGGYATADVTYRSRGIITINFNTVYNNDYGAEIYRDVVKNTIDYILTCINEG